MINFKFKIKLRTCLRNSFGDSQGHVSDINNNINNIIYILFNKYKSNFSFEKNLQQKKDIFFKTCAQDEDYKKLTEEEKTFLYTKLISLI